MAQVVCSVKGIQLTEKCGSEGYRDGIVEGVFDG